MDGCTGRKPLKAKGEDGGENYASEHFGCEYGLVSDRMYTSRHASQIWSFAFPHTILHDLRFVSDPVMGQDGVVIVALPLFSTPNSTPLIGLVSRMFVEL